MTLASTQRKYQAPVSRYSVSAKKRNISWGFLNQKICAMAKNHASPKELSDVIAQNEEFAEIVVRRAGCKTRFALDNATITHAILLLGVDRLCELAVAMA